MVRFWFDLMPVSKDGKQNCCVDRLLSSAEACILCFYMFHVGLEVFWDLRKS